MNARLRHSGTALYLALVAVMMNVLLPQGFMLGPADGGEHRIGLILCNGGGPQFSPDVGDAAHADHHLMLTQSCAFAHAAMPGLPSVDLSLFSSAPLPFAATVPPSRLRVADSRPRPPATGPPALA
ncbi:hypothetical protein RM530_12110 [Algiphilus sp. W345]|uniref:DUF2946 domain-containing protein n=1 Tax=Banduia mediterranea TaxID=3075609 RepID=A0ABU2WM24_9GAMM|nr:DUF2946 family protein [Algiphilus sp. W345]MDT0498102.1 hypothetical protein [Algiphilus sp. W345]